MYSLCFKLYTNYTQNPTLQLERQRVKETKRLRVGESTVNGQWSTVNGQRDKERKRLRDKGRKNRLFETLILYFLRKISSIDFYLKYIKREGRGIAKARNLFVEISFKTIKGH